MKPAAFEYFAPATVDEAVALLHEHGDEAKILAGGQSLMPLNAPWKNRRWYVNGIRCLLLPLDQEKRGWTTSLDREIRFRFGLDSFFWPPVP